MLADLTISQRKKMHHVQKSEICMSFLYSKQCHVSIFKIIILIEMQQISCGGKTESEHLTNCQDSVQVVQICCWAISRPLFAHTSYLQLLIFKPPDLDRKTFKQRPDCCKQDFQLLYVELIGKHFIVLSSAKLKSF